MYKMTVKENMMDSSKFEIWEKEAKTLEEVSELYAGYFPVAINLIVEFYKILISKNPELEPVFLQVIDALQSLEVNEAVVFNGTDAPFFTSDKNFLEFQLAGKYILAHVEEV